MDFAEPLHNMACCGRNVLSNAKLVNFFKK